MKRYRYSADLPLKIKINIQHEKDFYQLLRAYLNILLWAEKKTEVKKILDSFDGLRHEIKNTIIEKIQSRKIYWYCQNTSSEKCKI